MSQQVLGQWLIVVGLFGLAATGIGFLWIFRHKL
jgi:hypothetical protein